MKSLKTLSLNIPEQDYHDYPAWSYSIIAKYAKSGFEVLPTLHDKTEPTPSMRFGSLFDSVLTRGRKTLDEYVVFDGSIDPSAEKVLNCIYNKYHAQSYADITSEMFEQAMEECQYYTRWKLDTKIAKLSEFADYYNAIASGKNIVSQNEWDDAIEMAKIFRTDPYLKGLFGTKNTADMEYIYQSQFVYDWTTPKGNRVKVKIMPDLLVVNHREKTVQPVDLKTSSAPAWKFTENFLNFHYYIQATLYSDVLNAIMTNDKDYESYIVMPYLFTDISRTDKVPVTYLYDQTHPTQWDGFCFEKNGKEYKYKGWQTLLDEILSYEKSHATVPSYIETDKPNNLLEILKLK